MGLVAPGDRAAGLRPQCWEELTQLQSQTRQADNQWTIGSGCTPPPLGPPNLARASRLGHWGWCLPASVCPFTQAWLGRPQRVLFAQPRGVQPLTCPRGGRVARTKLRGPLQALYFLSLPSPNPEAHLYPKEASEASRGLADSPGGWLLWPSLATELTHGINSQGHTQLILSCLCFLPFVASLGLPMSILSGEVEGQRL